MALGLAEQISIAPCFGLELRLVDVGSAHDRFSFVTQRARSKGRERARQGRDEPERGRERLPGETLLHDGFN